MKNWWLWAAIILAIAVLCTANGDHLFDKQIAQDKAARQAIVSDLMNRPRETFVVREGRSEVDILEQAKFPQKENIKQDILLQVFWKINGGERILHPGEEVEFPLAKD